ncbi:MAG: hypothetical protein ABI193_20660 [Minicystis sp.]
MVRRALGLSIALLALPGSARGEEPPPRLEARLVYTVGAGISCPREPVLHGEVMRRLGYDPLVPDAKRRIVATVGREGGRLFAQIDAFDEAGALDWDKRFAGYPNDACLVLFAKMGLAIAFHLDPRIYGPEPALPAPPAPPSAPVPSPAAPLPPPVPPAVKQEAPRVLPPVTPAHIEIGVGPQMAIGPAGVVAGALVHAGLRWSFLSLGLELRYDLSTSARAETVPSAAHLAAAAIGGTVAPCAHLSAFFGCVIVSAGAIRVTGSDIDVAEDRSRPYLGAGPRLGLEQRLVPWLGVRAHGEALFMLRESAVTAGGAPVLLPSPLASRVNGAVGVSLTGYFLP